MDQNAPEEINTRIVSQRELIVGGVSFQWWAVGEHPAMVTVRASGVGRLTKSTDGDVAQFAVSLAKELLEQHRARAGRAPSEKTKSPQRPSGLSKPGWFEPGEDVDFSTTVF